MAESGDECQRSEICRAMRAVSKYRSVGAPVDCIIMKTSEDSDVCVAFAHDRRYCRRVMTQQEEQEGRGGGLETTSMRTGR